MQGTVPGVRKQRRPKMRWMDDMKKWAKMSFERLLKNTEDRWKWRRLIHEASNPWNEDKTRQSGNFHSAVIIK